MITLTLDRATGLKMHDGTPTADERAAGLVEAVEAYRDGRMHFMSYEPQSGGVEALERAGFVFEVPAESTSFTEPAPVVTEELAADPVAEEAAAPVEAPEAPAPRTSRRRNA